MRFLALPVFFSLSSATAQGSTFLSQLICHVDIIDLNTNAEDKDFASILYTTNPLFMSRKPKDVLECLMVSPKQPVEEHIKIVLQKSFSPVLQDYTSTLVTFMAIGEETGIVYYVRSAHAVAQFKTSSVLTSQTKLAVQLLNEAQQYLK